MPLNPTGSYRPTNPVLYLVTRLANIVSSLALRHRARGSRSSMIIVIYATTAVVVVHAFLSISFAEEKHTAVYEQQATVTAK